MKVKPNHILLALCCTLLMTLLGCKEQGLTFTADQVCFTDAQGNNQCKPLTASAWVVMENQDGNLTLDARDPQSITASGSGGGTISKSEFIKALKRGGAIKAFDPNAFSLSWKGNDLFLENKADSSKSERFNLDGAKAVLLLRDELSSEVMLSAYGASGCDSVVDIDQHVMQSDLDGDGIFAKQFRVCGTTLEGFVRIQDGGPIIVVVDPAVMDPDLMVTRFGTWLDPKIDIWLKSHSLEKGIASFIRMEGTNRLAAPASPLLGNADIKPIAPPVANYKSPCGDEPAPDTDTLCILNGLAQVEECNAIFSFSLNGAKLGMTLDNHLCTLTLVMDPANNKTIILTNPECRASFGDVSCQ